MSWVTVHRIEELEDGKTARLILKCVGCSRPEHRINYELPIPMSFEPSEVTRHRATAAWLEHVRIMAEAGCTAAKSELESRLHQGDPQDGKAKT